MKTEWLTFESLPFKVRYNGPTWVARLMVKYYSPDNNRFVRWFVISLTRLSGGIWEYADK